jgi:hypothetical protein
MFPNSTEALPHGGVIDIAFHFAISKAWNPQKSRSVVPSSTSEESVLMTPSRSRCKHQISRGLVGVAALHVRLCGGRLPFQNVVANM